jgi:atypical dual specificity phosphatase
LELSLVREFGFDYLHVPVEDFTAPTQGQIDQVIEFVEGALAEEKKVLMHCWAGIGRTGTLLACFLVSRGIDPAEAIARIRRQRPGSLEAYEQEYAVYQYGRRLEQEGGDG